MEQDTELIEEFVSESKEHLDSIEDDFLVLEKQKHDPEKKLIDKIFRAIHSIKGAAGFLGLEKINDLSHVMETILSMIRAKELVPETHIIDALLSGVDMLNTLLDDINGSKMIDITESYNRLNNILSSDISQKTKEELATGVTMVESDGTETVFEINAFTLNNIPGNYTLYVLQYDLMALSRAQKSPLELIRNLLKFGDILDAVIITETEDLHKGLPMGPITYDVLYATVFDSERISLVTGFPYISLREVGRKDALSRAGAERHLFPEDSFPPLPEEQSTTDTAGKAEPFESAEGEQEEVMDFSRHTFFPGEKDETLEGTAELTGIFAEEEEKDVCAPVSRDPDITERMGFDFGNTVRIHVDVLDELMMLAGELVLVRNQHLISHDANDPQARSMAQRLDIVTSELQETIMRTRMQPIGKIFGKFPRVVREMGKKMGKRIRIHMTGTEVELDKTILESLADPLTHLIRNACDHGIETPQVRRNKGKPETGVITMKAYHEAGQINIEISDDGKGIDHESLKKAALSMKIATEAELSGMREKELLEIVLSPGFSTAGKVDDVSGRGVGMDVVKNGIENLGGSLELDSAFGQGLRVHLRLPLTLAIIPSLIVTSGNERFAIPQVNVVELVCLYDDDVRTRIECANDQEVYRLRNQLLPMVRLNEVLARKDHFTKEVRSEITETYRRQQEELTGKQHAALPGTAEEGNSQFRMQMNLQEKGFTQSMYFAVLKVGTGQFGLIINDILGTEEIVVKPMHPAVKSLGIYSGATIMGDGKVALILDIEGVARHAGIFYEKETEALKHARFRDKEERQTVLLFRYGPEEVFALSLPLIRRIEHIRMDRVEKIGGREFINIDGNSTMIIRMNSLFSVSSLQEEKEEMYLLLPRHIKKHVGILVSELVDIEEDTIELDVDSYIEDGLLGTAIIREQMTLFLDIFRLVEKADPEWFRERRSKTGDLGKNKKILLVEDTHFFRHLVKNYLEADGYRVTTAENGQEALELLRTQGPFDICVSDLEMPVMNGWEFVRQVRKGKMQNNIPVIALTILDTEQDREKARSAGFDRYEIKIDKERFLKTVSEMLPG